MEELGVGADLGSEKVAVGEEGSEFNRHLRKWEEEEKEDEPKPACKGEGDIRQW